MNRFELERQYDIASGWRGMPDKERRFTFDAIKDTWLPATDELGGGEELAEAFKVVMKQIGTQTGQQ